MVFPRTKESPRLLKDVKKALKTVYSESAIKYDSEENNLEISTRNVPPSWIGYKEFDFFDDMQRDIWSMFIWKDIGWLCDNSEESINIWTFILHVCEALKSEECWIISELASDYLIIDEGPQWAMEQWHNHCHCFINVLNGEPVEDIEKKPLMYTSVDDMRQIVNLLSSKKNGSTNNEQNI